MPPIPNMDDLDRDRLTQLWVEYRRAVYLKDQYAAGYHRGRADEYCAQNAIDDDGRNYTYRLACRHSVNGNG